MMSSFSSRVTDSKILLKSTPECLFGWSYIILKLHDAAPHWDLLLLWTPTAGEIICHFNLWCNYSKETSLRSSLIVIESSELLQRARLLITLIYGVTIQKKPLWDRHCSSLLVIESSELLQRARLLVTLISGVSIQKKPLWDRHWSSLIVIESSELLQRARLFITLISGVTIQKKPLWDRHWSSLIVIGRHWSSLSPLNFYSGQDSLSL